MTDVYQPNLRLMQACAFFYNLFHLRGFNSVFSRFFLAKFLHVFNDEKVIFFCILVVLFFLRKMLKKNWKFIHVFKIYVNLIKILRKVLKLY